MDAALRPLAGVAIGLVAASLLLPAASPAPGPTWPALGVVLSDGEGALRDVVLHYVPESAEVVERAYEDLLRQLPSRVRVHVVCPDEGAFADLARRLGPLARRLASVPVHHAMTCWSRDRWLAIAAPGDDGPTTLLLPREEDGETIWPARAGDARTGEDLAAARPGRVRAWRSALAFDGGDFVVGADHVFVAPRVARRNVGRTVRSKAELRDALRTMLGRDVVLLPDAPDHHAGMYLALLPGKTALVGDPAAAMRLMAVARTTAPLDIDADPATQARFDAVADACAAAGYRVVRVPVVPGRDGRTWVTYLNVLLDEEDGQGIVYLPVFAGAEALNRVAAQVWHGLGYEVRPVDCSDAYRRYGSLRCLVNVLRRG